MRKRTAIILCGTLLSGMCGYVGWCFRPYYLRPRLEFEGSVSPEGRSAAERWKKTPGYPGAEKFDRSRALEYLQYPWDDWCPSPVVVTEEAGCGLWATRRAQMWVFSKSGGEWSRGEFVSEYIFFRGITDEIKHQGGVASRMEELGMGEGVTMEVLTLGPYGAGEKEDADPATPPRVLFHYANIVDRIAVSERERREELVEALAREIRVTADAGHHNAMTGPGFGMILRKGNEKMELEIWPAGQFCFVFGDGVDGRYDPDDTDGMTAVAIRPPSRDVLEAFISKCRGGGLTREK